MRAIKGKKVGPARGKKGRRKPETASEKWHNTQKKYATLGDGRNIIFQKGPAALSHKNGVRRKTAKTKSRNRCKRGDQTPA